MHVKGKDRDFRTTETTVATHVVVQSLGQTNRKEQGHGVLSHCHAAYAIHHHNSGSVLMEVDLSGLSGNVQQVIEALVVDFKVLDKSLRIEVWDSGLVVFQEGLASEHSHFAPSFIVWCIWKVKLHGLQHCLHARKCKSLAALPPLLKLEAQKHKKHLPRQKEMNRGLHTSKHKQASKHQPLRFDTALQEKSNVGDVDITVHWMLCVLSPCGKTLTETLSGLSIATTGCCQSSVRSSRVKASRMPRIVVAEFPLPS